MNPDPKDAAFVNLVAEALELLPEPQREVLILANVRNLRPKEISGILGIKETTVRWRMYDARVRLRKEVERLDASKNEQIVDVSEVISHSKELSPFLISHLKQHPGDMYSIDPRVFEHLIAEFFAARGYVNVSVVGKDSWTGADVVAMSRDHRSGVVYKYFVEVKRWRNLIGVEVVDRVLGALQAERHRYGWHIGMIVGLKGFKRMRRDNSATLGMFGIELRGVQNVRQWLDQYRPSKSGLWLPTPSNPKARGIYSGQES